MKEAAAYAEKAGDLMQAATMFQEVGDFARAGDLFFQAGFYAEAAENFSLVNDLARAAEAHERAGNYLQAAQALRDGRQRQGKTRDALRKGRGFLSGRPAFRQARAAGPGSERTPAGRPRLDKLRERVAAGRHDLPQAGTDRSAREKFLKIIDNQPVGKSNLEPYYFLALCHEHAGDAENAKAIFAKILAEDYNFRDVRKRLAG